MKTFFRLVVFILLIGGWTVAASSLYIIRTAGKEGGQQKLLVVPKDHLTFHDTYVDTRNWTLENVRQHPVVVGRLIYLNKVDALANVVDTTKGPIAAQLTDAIEHPEVPPEPAMKGAVDHVEETVKVKARAATQGVKNESKSVFDF